MIRPPDQVNNLGDLMQQATHYVDFCMHKSGKLVPAMMLLSDAGVEIVTSGGFRTDGDQESFLQTARLLSVARAATACILMVEAWVKLAKPGESLDPNERPSEAFDRKEVIALMGESYEGPKRELLEIVRSGNGKFFALRKLEIPQFDSVQDRTAGILPPTRPDRRLRKDAKRALAAVGVQVVPLQDAVPCASNN